MNSIIDLSDDELELVINNTAEKMNLSISRTNSISYKKNNNLY